MKYSGTIGLALAATLALVPTIAQAETAAERAAAAEERKRLGSLYLRCDGQPNNVTGAESFARLLGAVTLLGLFAPSPEAPDPAKRLFGEKGVDACTQLLDDPKQETNPLRRVPLILARAAHQIEAKNYPAAIADIEKARGEARAQGLVGNPYFDRSMGLSFDNLEAKARLRMGDAQGAQDISLRRVDTLTYSYVPLLFAEDFAVHVRGLTPRAEKLLTARVRFDPVYLNDYARRLEEAGRFADAAAQREAMIATVERLKPEHPFSSFYAVAALNHALAGNWDKARERAEFARSNMEARIAAGVPEDNPGRSVEMLDLYDILVRAQAGDLTGARRSFAARSRWTEPGLGTVMEASRRLRAGAPAAELTGALAATPEQLWEERRAAALAAELKSDTENRALFTQIVPYAQIGDFEARSKDVYRVDKSRLMLEKPSEKSGLSILYSLYAPAQTRVDSLMLHAALQAQKAGKQGFVVGMVPRGLGSMQVLFVNRDEAGANAGQFVDAGAVIAELGAVIPSPAELAARKTKR